MAKKTRYVSKLDRDVYVYETLGFEVLGAEFDPSKSLAENYRLASELVRSTYARRIEDFVASENIPYVGCHLARDSGGSPRICDYDGNDADIQIEPTTKAYVYETIAFFILGTKFDPTKSHRENYRDASRAVWDKYARTVEGFFAKEKIKFFGPYLAHDSSGEPVFCDQSGSEVPPPAIDWGVDADFYRHVLNEADSREDFDLCLSAAACFVRVGDKLELANAVRLMVNCIAEDAPNESPNAKVISDFFQSPIPLEEKEHIASFFNVMADEFHRRWGDSAAVCHWRGLAADYSGDTDSAINWYVRALGKDETFWLSASCCAWIYYAQKNFRTAAGYYRRALEQVIARQDAALWHNAGLCYLKAKEFEDAVVAFRQLLNVAPDFQYARNDLGWSLIKAGKYDEAVGVLKDVVERGIDGNYAIGNLALAFQKLRRYEEAIELLRKHVTGKGELTSFAAKRIARLTELLAKAESRDVTGTDVDSDSGLQLSDDAENQQEQNEVEEDRLAPLTLNQALVEQDS